MNWLDSVPSKSEKSAFPPLFSPNSADATNEEVDVPASACLAKLLSNHPTDSFCSCFLKLGIKGNSRGIFKNGATQTLAANGLGKSSSFHSLQTTCQSIKDLLSAVTGCFPP